MFEKSKVLAQLHNMIKEEIEVTTRAAHSAHEAATHSELVAENKYDTKGLEASYLAGAQARRANELQKLLDELEIFQKRELPRTSTASIGSLVKLSNDDSIESWVFILPSQGGYKIEIDKTHIQTITPQSPIGKALLGKSIDDELEIAKKDAPSFYDVLEIL